MIYWGTGCIVPLNGGYWQEKKQWFAKRKGCYFGEIAEFAGFSIRCFNSLMPALSMGALAGLAIFRWSFG